MRRMITLTLLAMMQGSAASASPSPGGAAAVRRLLAHSKSPSSLTSSGASHSPADAGQLLPPTVLPFNGSGLEHDAHPLHLQYLDWNASNFVQSSSGALRFEANRSREMSLGSLFLGESFATARECLLEAIEVHIPPEHMFDISEVTFETRDVDMEVQLHHSCRTSASLREQLAQAKDKLSDLQEQKRNQIRQAKDEVSDLQDQKQAKMQELRQERLQAQGGTTETTKELQDAVAKLSDAIQRQQRYARWQVKHGDTEEAAEEIAKLQQAIPKQERLIGEIQQNLTYQEGYHRVPMDSRAVVSVLVYGEKALAKWDHRLAQAKRNMSDLREQVHEELTQAKRNMSDLQERVNMELSEAKRNVSNLQEQKHNKTLELRKAPAKAWWQVIEILESKQRRDIQDDIAKWNDAIQQQQHIVETLQKLTKINETSELAQIAEQATEQGDTIKDNIAKLTHAVLQQQLDIEDFQKLAKIMTSELAGRATEKGVGIQDDAVKSLNDAVLQSQRQVKEAKENLTDEETHYNLDDELLTFVQRLVDHGQGNSSVVLSKPGQWLAGISRKVWRYNGTRDRKGPVDWLILASRNHVRDASLTRLKKIVRALNVSEAFRGHSPSPSSAPQEQVKLKILDISAIELKRPKYTPEELFWRKCCFGVGMGLILAAALAVHACALYPPDDFNVMLTVFIIVPALVVILGIFLGIIIYPAPMSDSADAWGFHAAWSSIQGLFGSGGVNDLPPWYVCLFTSLNWVLIPLLMIAMVINAVQLYDCSPYHRCDYMGFFAASAGGLCCLILVPNFVVAFNWESYTYLAFNKSWAWFCFVMLSAPVLLILLAAATGGLLLLVLAFTREIFENAFDGPFLLAPFAVVFLYYGLAGHIPAAVWLGNLLQTHVPAVAWALGVSFFGIPVTLATLEASWFVLPAYAMRTDRVTCSDGFDWEVHVMFALVCVFLSFVWGWARKDVLRSKTAVGRMMIFVFFILAILDMYTDAVFICIALKCGSQLGLWALGFYAGGVVLLQYVLPGAGSGSWPMAIWTMLLFPAELLEGKAEHHPPALEDPAPLSVLYLRDTEEVDNYQPHALRALDTVPSKEVKKMVMIQAILRFVAEDLPQCILQYLFTVYVKRNPIIIFSIGSSIASSSFAVAKAVYMYCTQEESFRKLDEE